MSFVIYIGWCGWIRRWLVGWLVEIPSRYGRRLMRGERGVDVSTRTFSRFIPLPPSIPFPPHTHTHTQNFTFPPAHRSTPSSPSTPSRQESYWSTRSSRPTPSFSSGTTSPSRTSRRRTTCWKVRVCGVGWLKCGGGLCVCVCVCVCGFGAGMVGK
jgi:hypothetical protein